MAPSNQDRAPDSRGKTRKAGKHRQAPRWLLAQDHTSESPQGQRIQGQPSETWHQDADRSPRVISSVASEPDAHHVTDSDAHDNPSLSGRVMSTILARPSDALDVLFDAARPGVDESPSSQARDRDKTQTVVSASGLVSVSGLSHPSEDVLDLWDRCRFEKYSTAKTRIVGSIESLILISDWNPRSVHFPPETEGWDGELISPAYDRRNRLQTGEDVPLIRWREDVFEPAKRSERMSWMLLGAAVTLGYELGVFSDGPLLLIEYHHLRAYTSALAIQAVVERAVTRGVSWIGETSRESVDACLLPHDQDFIRDVILSSSKVLEIATHMAADGMLRYAPLRTLVCVTSSSVYLLKAISLGVHHTDLQASLHTLDQCIVALRSSGTDDMDFSLRYARLIEKHVDRFRANFVSDRVATMHPDHQRYHLQTPEPLTSTQPDGRPHMHSASSSYPGQQSSDAFATPPMNSWWAQPFDPNIAPFNFNGEGVSIGFELDSLDFLLNLPQVGGE
ncbi:unnamed protein product [Aspergillus oryzae]|nr:unnamed protein product [Aspergillus oryzae]